MCSHWFIILCMIVAAAISKSKGVPGVLARDRLLSHLFENYDAHSRPAPKGQVIKLQIGLELHHFDYHASDGAFNFAGVLNLIWADPKLSWDPSYYNNISRLTIDQKLIWVPDIEVYNNVASKFLHMHKEGIIFLEHTGHVRYSDTVDMAIFCTATMKNWPHDKHTCELQLGSWMYDGLEVDMHTAQPNKSIFFDDKPILNNEYKLIEFSAEHVRTKYACCTEPYITINYIIQFQRKVAFATIFHALAFCMVILNLLALMLPPGQTLKLWLNSGSLMLVIANLLYFASKVGKFARETPLIVTFHCLSLYMITVAFLLAIFSIFATRSGFGKGRIANCFSKLLRSRLSNLITSRRIVSSEENPENSCKFVDIKLIEDERNLLSSTGDIEDWFILALFMERVALTIYITTYVIAALICFL